MDQGLSSGSCHFWEKRRNVQREIEKEQSVRQEGGRLRIGCPQSQVKEIYQERRVINSVNRGTSQKTRTENQPVNLAEWRSLVTFLRKFQQNDEILTEKRVEEEGN